MSSSAATLATPAPTLLDVSDVSVLFPYSAATGKLSPDLPLDSFISQKVFSQVIEEASSQGLTDSNQINFSVYDNWRIVGFRFDPCAPADTMALGQIPADLVGVVPGCLVELRLIAQPVTLRGPNAPIAEVGPGLLPISEFPSNVASPQDYGMHLMYDVGVYQGSAEATQLQANFASCEPSSTCSTLLQGLTQIKALSAAAGANTNGAFLGVHLGLQAEVASGGTRISAAVAAYLQQVLAPTKLTRATFFGVPSSAFLPWTFLGGDVTSDAGPQKFVDVPIPGFPSAIASQTVPRFNQVPTNPVSLTTIVNNGPADREAGIEGEFELNDPATRNILDTDCASCHATNLATDQSGTKIETIADLSPTRFVPARGVTGYISSEAFNTADWFFHDFGYFGPAPRVSERALNETAMVVEVVNTILAGAAPVNPGLDCGSDRATLDSIYFCQMTNLASESARQACFSPCKLTPALGSSYVITNIGSGMVLDVFGNSTANGAAIDIYPQNKQSNQTWTLMAPPANSPANTFVLQSLNSAKVLDVPGLSGKPGLPLDQWSANNGWNQSWTFTPSGNGYKIGTGDGLVLDTVGESTTPSTLVDQNTPNGATTQLWTLTPVAAPPQAVLGGSYVITNVGSGMALDVFGDSTTNGARIDIYPQNNQSNQTWTFLAPPASSAVNTFVLQSLSSGKVLDVPGLSSEPGLDLDQWTANGGWNQSWTFTAVGNGRYTIGTGDGLVLDTAGELTTASTLVDQARPNGASTQRWTLAVAP